MAESEEQPEATIDRKTIVFIHPDLGIGGAERLVVDAAVGLQGLGYRVVIFTSHCDPKHCFDEARDGTLDVRVRGNTLIPPSILSRFHILCAILRQLHLLVQIGLLTSELAELCPDAYFVDQLSAGLPLLSHLSFPSSPVTPHKTEEEAGDDEKEEAEHDGGSRRPPKHRPILFYCHFPDLLLARGRASWWKRLYRVPFDRVEEWSMGFADGVAVNSAFTRGVVASTWPRLAARTDLRVVYPCVDVREGVGKEGTTMRDEDNAGRQQQLEGWRDCEIILSINRFEHKKNVALAIRAFAGLSEATRKRVKLVIAGGYDKRVPENVANHAELAELATSLGLRTATTADPEEALSLARGYTPGSSSSSPSPPQVLFLLSVPSPLKRALLGTAQTRLLVYTPAQEHFGIVPLEAMLAGVPVLACDSGGPTETVVEGVTGWLRSPLEVGSWTEVMDLAVNRMTEEQRATMGRAGPERVRSGFSDLQMARRLDGIYVELMQTRGGGDCSAVGLLPAIFAGLFAFLAVFVLIVAVVFKRTFQ